MRKHSLGKRLLAMVLVFASVVGYLPGIVNAYKYDRGEIVPGEGQKSTNIKGELNTNDTIRWPIKIYDYLIDGMLFEYSYAGDTSITEQGGGAYGGGQAMPIIEGDGIVGVDYTSVNGYFKNGTDTAKYAFVNWGKKSAYSYNIDTSSEGATEVERSIGQPVKDKDPMRLHLKYKYNTGDYSKSYGWVSNFAKDDSKYYSKEELRYVVMVYRTNEAFTSHNMSGYWAVSDNAYSSSADISDVSSSLGKDKTGTMVSDAVTVHKSTEWTYVILDMKSNTTDSYGIAKNWSKIKDNRIAGVGLCYPLSADGEEMDISHIAYFPNADLAKYFGERCIMFNNDPGEYVGRKITLTHAFEDGKQVATVTAPTVSKSQSLNLTKTESDGGSWAATAVTRWTSKDKLTVTNSKSYGSGGYRYARIKDSSDTALDTGYVIYSTSANMKVDDYRYVTVVYRTNVSSPKIGFWLENGSNYAGKGFNGTSYTDKRVSITKSTSEWVSFVYDLAQINNWDTDYNKNFKGKKFDSIGIMFPGFTSSSQYMDIAYVDFFSSSEQADAFASEATNYLNTFIVKNQTSVTTTVTRASAPASTDYNGKLWNMGSNQAFTMLYASKGGGWGGTGGANSSNNGYYSYQIGYPYNGSSTSTANTYRNNATSQGLNYKVSDTIFLLNTYGSSPNNTYKDSNGVVCVDMSKMDLGYTLYNTMKDQGVMTAGLLQSSQGKFISMDGAERTVMQYKDEAIHYIATLLRDTLVIPERDYYGYNYTFVKGTASSQFCEDVDGDGKLDLYNEDLDGDGHLDAINEDVNGNGVLDKTEDLDNDGHLDVNEDLDGDGELDRAEDLDRDGRLDTFEDMDYDGLIDPGDDIDGDGKLDVGEDKNYNGILDEGEDLNGNGVLDWAHEDRNYNGILDEGEDLNGNGKLDYWGEDLNRNGKLDKGEDIDGDGRLDREDEDKNGNGKLDLGEDLDGDNHLDCGEVDLNGNGVLDPEEDINGNGKWDKTEDLDSDGNLDICEDGYMVREGVYLGVKNDKLDECDLASALRKLLGIEFTEDHLNAKTKAAAQNQPNKAKLGSYVETSKKFNAGPNGANQLIGPFLKCAPYIETFYDAAYYILHNIFVPGSYNNVEDDYNYLVMSKATVLSENKEAYVFDAGFTGSDGSASTVYDSVQKIIYQTTAADKWEICYVSGETVDYLTTLRPFLPINDFGESMDEEYRYSQSPYVRDDQTTTVNDYGATYALRNYNYVMTATGEFVYHHDDGLFFDFEGDDDVYMFINGELVLDIGAAHSITKVGFNMNDYVDAARAVLSKLSGYAPGMDDANLDKVLASNGVTSSKGLTISSGTYKGTYSISDLKRLHKLNLVDGDSYPIDFYYMERHGWGANMRIATNIVMTDPSMETDKQAYQGEDANGELKEIQFGSLVDDSKPINYSFSITNGQSVYDASKKDSNTKLYRLAFQDFEIGVDLSPTNGLQVFGKPTTSTFTAESGTVIDISGLNGIMELDGVRYRVTLEGNFVRTKADGGTEVLEQVVVPASANPHTLILYQYNSSELFTDVTANVILGGGSGTPIIPLRSDKGVYALAEGRVNEISVGGVRVADANGGILDPSDLTFTVSGYASEEDFKAGKRMQTLTVKVSNQQELMSFLTNLQDPKGQTGSGEGVPTGKSALYWGAGLWKNATVTVSGMWYSMTEQEQEAKVFENTVYTQGYKSLNSADPLHGQASHRVYSPGEPSYYQWAGHTINLDIEQFWNDFIESSTDPDNPLFEQNVGITALKAAGLDSASFKVVNSTGGDLQVMDNYYDDGLWRTWPDSKPSDKEGYRDIYYKQIHDWDEVYVYYWSDSNPSMIQWPGEKMTLAGESSDGLEVYTQKIPNDAQYVIFSNGVNNPINVQTKNISLPVVDYDAVEFDNANGVLKVNFTSVGMHMFYVLVTSTETDQTALVPVSFYVTDMKDKVFVLDYGLRSEDMNLDGFLFRGDELLGSHASTAAKLMGITTKEPTYMGAYSSAAQKNNNLNRIDFTPMDMTASGGERDESEYIQLSDGKFYLGTAIDETGSLIRYTNGRYILDKRVWFTPEKVMDEEYNVWMAVTVHFGNADMGAGAGNYHMPAPKNDSENSGGEIDIGTEVQLFKKITIVPATVVYYEDDFSDLHYNGDILSSNDKTAGKFVHHGAGSGVLTQGIAPETPYGQDTTYQGAANDQFSGQSMTTIRISDTDSVASFGFKGTGFEIISRTNSFDSGSFVINVFKAIEKNNQLIKDGNEPIKKLPVITEFTSPDLVCKHNHHTPNGYCSYCNSKVSHKYENGKCTICQAKMENYYLIGYINGADRMDISDYKFVDGRLTVKFNQDSYVMVRDDSGNQYWTNGYPGDSATSANLFNVGKYEGQMEANKLHVPGGVELTMNLMDNGEGGLVLSYFREPVNYGERTLYFSTTNTEWSVPYIYFWSETNSMMVEWPGVKMFPVEEEGVENMFYYVVPSDATKVIFSDGVGGGFRQTPDQTIPGDHMLYDYEQETRKGTWSSYGVEEEEEEVITSNTVYFENTAGWKQVLIYYWNNDVELVAWPGVPMTQLEAGGKRYVYELPLDATHLIFTEGDGLAKTPDLIVQGDEFVYKNGAWYDFNGLKVEDNTKLIYFKNTYGTTPKAYYWIDGNNGSVAWPGVDMTRIPGTDYYYVRVESAINRIIFNDGKGSQTADLTVVDTTPTYENGVWTDKVPSSSVRTLYFKNTENWEQVYVYFWSDANGAMTKWSGVKMELAEGNTYVADIPADAQYVKFTDGTVDRNEVGIPVGGGNFGDYDYFINNTWVSYLDPVINVYFRNTSKWDNVLIHYWNDNGDITTWPGQLMMLEDAESGLYSMKLPVDAKYVIFSDGEGHQSADQEIPGNGLVYNNGRWYTLDKEPKPEPAQLITVYYKNTTSQWDSVSAYVWGGSQGEYLGVWPGTEMTHVEGDVYSIQIPVDAAGLQFNDSGNGGQTGDLVAPGDGYAYNGTEWWVYGEEEPTPEEVQLITVYYKNTTSQWEKVSAYVWGGSHGMYLGSWPGTEMTHVEGDVYSIQIPADATGLQFNGSGSGGQTGDLVAPGDGYAYNGTAWWVYGEEEPTPEPTPDPNPTPDPDPEPEETITLYFDNSTIGWTNIHAYYWAEGKNPVSWPGVLMTNVSGNIWSVELPASMENIIFNNGNGGTGNQSADLVIPGDNALFDGENWLTYLSGDSLNSGNQVLNQAPALLADDTVTIYYNNTANGWSDVHAYYWAEGNNPVTWPGVNMEQLDENTYVVQVPSDVDKIIFNGTEGQTADLSIPGDGYEYNGSSWNVYGAEDEPVTYIKIYYNNETNGWSDVHAYYWAEGNNPVTWPGVVMTHVSGNLYVVEVPDTMTNIIFNNGNSGEENQTSDLVIPGGNYVFDSILWSEYEPEDSEQPDPENPEEPTSVVVYYNNADTGWTDVYAYYWGGSTTVSWPGVKMELVEYNIYKLVIPGDAESIIFNNKEGVQSADLNVQGDGYVFDGTAWDVYVPGMGGVEPDDPEVPDVPEQEQKPVDRTLYFQNVYGWSEPWVYLEYANGSSAYSAMTRGYADYYLFMAHADTVKIAFTDGNVDDLSAVRASAMELPADKNLYTVEMSWQSYDESTNTLYFDNAVMGWDKVYAYTWGDGGQSAEWPGVAMTHVSGTIYKVELHAGMNKIIFNNNAGQQTSDMDIPAAGSIYGKAVWTDMGGKIIFFRNEYYWDEVYITYGNTEAGVFVPAPGILMQEIAPFVWSYLVPAGNDSVNFYSGDYTDCALPENDNLYEAGNWYSYSDSIGKEIQQVPVIRVNDLEYGYYIVEISGMPQYKDGTDWSLIAKLQGVVDAGNTAAADLMNFKAQYSAVDWDKIAQLDDLSKRGDADAREELNQLVADNQIDWTKYEALQSEIKQGSDAKVQLDSYKLESTKDTYLYIDGFRVFQPMGPSNQHYYDRENTAAFKELRNLILNGEAAVATRNADMSSIYSGNYSWTENRNGDFIGSQIEKIDDYLRFGPNNETYVNANLNDQAVIFYVKETKGQTGPAPVRTLQVGVRGLDTGLFTKGEATGVYATIYQGAETRNPDGTMAFGWMPLTTVLSGTEQYYEINYGSCPYTVDNYGNKIYQVALSVRQGMVAFTSLKYMGFEIVGGLAEQTSYVLREGIYMSICDTEGSGTGSGESGEAAQLNGAPIMNFASLRSQLASNAMIGDIVELPDEPETPDVPETPDEPEIPNVPEIGTVVIPTLIPKYATLSFEDLIRYNFYFEASKLDDVVEMGLVTFADRLADGTMDNALAVFPGYTSDGTSFMVGTDGIAAKNMGDTVYFKIYAKLSDGSYQYSDIRGYNAVAYAKTILNKADSSAEMKALVVAMLNYGAAAQVAFGYNTDNLMNSFFTDEHLALVNAYDELTLDGLTAVDQTKAQNFVYEGGFSKRYATVSFDSAFSVNYYFTAAAQPDNGMKLYYWTLEDYNNANVLSLNNATGSMEMVATENDNQYWGQVVDIAAKQVGETVFVVGVYEVDGVVYTTGVLNYSISRYCQTLAADDASNMAGLAKATAIYGEYAEAYFDRL